jgi:hypothetical protein
VVLQLAFSKLNRVTLCIQSVQIAFAVGDEAETPKHQSRGDGAGVSRIVKQ